MLKMAKPRAKAKTAKIKITSPVAGKYLLSANVNDVIDIDANQAAEMVENKDAEFVK